MVVYLVCFDLEVPIEQQRDQIFYWLQFINTYVPNLPRFHSSSNWKIMIVGLREDLAKSQGLTSANTQHWQSQMPKLPIFKTLFRVSSFNSKKSVGGLLEAVQSVCSQIFEQHAVLIPSSFQKLLQSIKRLSDPSPSTPSVKGSANSIVIHFKDLY